MDIRNIELIALCPASIAGDPEIQAMSAALDPELRDVGAAIIEAVILPRIMEQPERVLDELAWGFGLLEVDGWDDCDLSRKRELMRDVFLIARRRGTVWAVRRALSIVHDHTSILTEWWQETPPGEPFSYRVALEVGPHGITAETLARARRLLLYYAPKSRYIEELSSVTIGPEAPAIMALAVTSGTTVTITEV